jgi:hypothetical protein
VYGYTVGAHPYLGRLSDGGIDSVLVVPPILPFAICIRWMRLWQHAHRAEEGGGLSGRRNRLAIHQSAAKLTATVSIALFSHSSGPSLNLARSAGRPLSAFLFACRSLAAAVHSSRSAVHYVTRSHSHSSQQPATLLRTQRSRTEARGESA